MIKIAKFFGLTHYSLNVLGNIILLCAVHYNYNALCGGLHDICNTAHSFDLRCESVT